MLDIFIIVVVLWAFFSGWRNGLLKELSSSLGFLVGLFIAASCYSTFGEYLAVNGTESNMITSIGAFFILWIIVPIALGLAANIMTKVVNHLHLGALNRIGGSAVSLVKFTVLLSCILSVMNALGILNEERTKESSLYLPIKGVVSSVIDSVIDDDVRPMEQVDQPATAGDTVWIERPTPSPSLKGGE